MAIGRSAIEAQILGLQPDNTEQLISPLDNRDSFQLVIDNFVNLEDNTFTNGLTLDGVSGDIKIGGALIENTTIEGGSFYSFNVSNASSISLDASSSNSNPTLLLFANNTSSFTGISTGLSVSGGQSQIYSFGQGLVNNGKYSTITTSADSVETTYYTNFVTNPLIKSTITFSATSMLLRDDINSRGLIYLSDYSTNYVDRSLTDKAYQDGHLASVTASALAQAPGAGQDGFALVYDHGTTSYTLASVGGGGSSTFDGLTDTPANKTGSSDFFVGVNSLETALEYISSASATARLDVFTDTLKGLVPLSGGGTDNFLRADGSWIVPDYSNIAITDNYIPIGNATNDGVEDSRLRILSSTSIPAGTYTDTITGAQNGQEFSYLTIGTTNNVFTAGTPTRKAFFANLRAGGSGLNDSSNIELAKDQNFSSLTADWSRLKVPGGTTKKVDLFNFWGVDVGITSTYFCAYGGVDLMGHKYGPSQDPRILTPSEAYTFVSDNNQHVQIGYGSSVGTQNAHLAINSFDTTTNPEPHLRFIGDYNTSNGAVSNNSMYLDSIDSKLHFIGSAGQNIILEDLANATVTENVIQASWSGNTSYQYAVSFSGAQVGEFFQVLPDEDIFAAINTAGAEWNGYAYCATAGTVTVVCRVTTFINIPASSIFTVKKIN